MSGVLWGVAFLICLVPRFAGSAVSTSMIVQMREITSVSVSPNGLEAVVGICHPNPATNRREISWVIVPIKATGKIKTIDAGQEINDPAAPGSLLNRAAVWSEDSRWFYYLRRRAHQIQIWRSRHDGKVTEQITQSAADLIDLRPSLDPNKFIIRLMPDRTLMDEAEKREYRNGVLYDDHVIGAFPPFKALPVIDRMRSIRVADSGEWMPPGPIDRRTTVFDVRSGMLSTPPVPILQSRSADHLQDGVLRFEVIEKDPPPHSGDYTGPYQIQVTGATGGAPVVKCELEGCAANRLSILGKSLDGTEIYYAADSLAGRAGARLPGLTTLHAWNWRTNSVRAIYSPSGRLYNLDKSGDLTVATTSIIGDEIVLAFSAADQPPRLEAINLGSGASRVLYDPNPTLRAFAENHARWITWHTASGYPGRGVIYLPDDYSAGSTYAAVVTTYKCGKGFLRGGGADGPPELMLAHYGIVAICVDMPVDEIMAHEVDHSLLYARMCDIVRDVIADRTAAGLLDPKRIGLSGQSLGANFGTYCISRSNNFAAAAFRHGSVIERSIWDLFETSAAARSVRGFYGSMDLPDPQDDPYGKWVDMSVALQADKIETPILIQNNDSEYLLALPLWSAVRDAHKPIEMFVFPEETHVLWQPVHRLVNYERQLDWFRFWLKHEEDEDPTKAVQYSRWRALRRLNTTNTENSRSLE